MPEGSPAARGQARGRRAAPDAVVQRHVGNACWARAPAPGTRCGVLTAGELVVGDGVAARIGIAALGCAGPRWRCRATRSSTSPMLAQRQAVAAAGSRARICCPCPRSCPGPGVRAGGHPELRTVRVPGPAGASGRACRTCPRTGQHGQACAWRRAPQAQAAGGQGAPAACLHSCSGPWMAGARRPD
ncbi:hypothetical protein FQR65_LT20288 [Abscondita terminalis]|nr:hypothetical protein FQR65_LT20288 [Abscondita terminalis]